MRSPVFMEQTNSASDAQLMREVVARSETALVMLYDRYKSRVFALSLRMLRDTHDAEEVVLDVFQELWEKSRRFNPKRASPRTYIMTLAHSRAIDRLRWNASRRGNNQVHDLDEVASPQASPLSQALLEEETEALIEALAALKPHHRQTLELAYFDRLTQREIAERLDLPLGSVKTFIRQAVLHLKKSMRSWRKGGGL